MKDQRGNEIVLRRPYLLIVGMPGPDVSLVMPLSTNNGIVRFFDLYYRIYGKCKPESLFQRYEFKWQDDEISKVRDYGGDWEFMQHHNEKIDSAATQEPTK